MIDGSYAVFFLQYESDFNYYDTYKSNALPNIWHDCLFEYCTLWKQNLQCLH